MRGPLGSQHPACPSSSTQASPPSTPLPQVSPRTRCGLSQDLDGGLSMSSRMSSEVQSTRGFCTLASIGTHADQARKQTCPAAQLCSGPCCPSTTARVWRCTVCIPLHGGGHAGHDVREQDTVTVWRCDTRLAAQALRNQVELGPGGLCCIKRSWAVQPVPPGSLHSLVACRVSPPC